MYLGLSNKLKEAFPDTIAVKKEQIVNNYNIIMSGKEWMAGFSTGESDLFYYCSKI